MRLLNPLWRFVANRIKAFIAGPGGAGFINSGAAQSPYEYGLLDRAYEINPWVNACVQRIADSVAAIPLRVYRESPDGDVEEVATHPLVDLLWKPGRFTSAYDLIHRTAANLALQGQFYWFIENGTAGQNLAPARPKEIRILRSDSMKITPDPLDIIKEYLYTGNGTSIPLKIEFVVHGKNYNPTDDYYGLPPVQVARSPVLLEYYLQRYNQLFFQNSARPDIALITDGPLTSDARTANMEAWKKAYGGLEKSHGVAILSNGTKPQLMGTNAKDGEFLGLDKLSREQICAIFQVPPVMVGVFEFANYANSEQQIQIFYEFTVKPMCSRIKDAINTQLIPVWYGSDNGLFVEFDYSDLKPLQGDLLKQAQVDQIQVNTGIKTVNEIRADMDLPPVAWGDEKPQVPTLGQIQGGATLAIDGPRFIKAPTLPTRTDQWKSFDRDLIKNERKIEKATRAFFEAQAQRVLVAFDKVSVFAAAGIPMEVRAISPDDLFAMFDLTLEDAEIKDALIPILRQIVELTGQGTIERVGSDAVFNVNDPRIQALLSAKELKITRINETTREMLRQVLIDASAENSTIAQTGQKIREMFDEFSRSRAETIARTEIISVQNGAAQEGYAQSGVVSGSEWLSARDDVVRDSHQMVDGTVAQLGGVFANGLMFPGDPSGPAEEVINCRCTTLPVLVD